MHGNRLKGLLTMFALGGAMDAAASSPPATERMTLLDGLRGLAALSVLGFHAQRAFHLGGPFASSYLFVDFFFLLSGFVLGMVAEPRMRAGLGWSGFMIARWRRLWPMIAVGALLGAIDFSATNDVETTALLLMFALLMVPTLSSTRELFPLNGPQWSLLMELLANLAHALLLVRLSSRKLAALTGVFGVLLLANILDGTENYWLLAELRVGFSYSLGLVFARAHRQSDWFKSAGLDWKIPVVLTGEIDLEAGIAAIKDKVPTLVVTCSADGAVAVSNGTRARVAAEPIDEVVDTTGAGDLFAAGFLYGHVRREPLATCLRRGAIAAAEVISHYGARPEADLQELMAEKLGA